MTELKILILLVFVLSLFMKPTSVLSAYEVGCIERERQALLKFKQGLIYDSDILSSWGSGEEKKECCKWEHVECSNKTGHVIRLDMFSILRGGKISPVLAELRHLNYLDFSYNDLRVDNLEWLSHLSLLKHLGLSGVNLNQTNWVQPISKLSFLEELYLSGCQLGNTLPAFDIFANSSPSSLSVLDLSKNDLASFSMNHSFLNLKELRLNDNQLNEFHPQSLEQPSSLEYLDLSNNKLGGSLPDLRAYSSLQQLALSNNQFKRLAEGIWQLSKLKKLDLSSNSLEGTITEEHLSSLANLDYLDLSYNSLALKLSSDWIPPFQMRTLYLRFCKVGPDFPKWLQTQESLSVLDMSFASISDTLPTWFWNLTSLSSLNLSYNHISGEIPGQSSSNVGFSSPVDLSSNNFSGPIPIFLFRSIDIRLSRNMFSGSISHLCTMSTPFTAEVLDLSDNQLTGGLPGCWILTGFLELLNLANNKFSGEIPPSLGSQIRLKMLHLRNNNLIGELPSSLKNCSDLRMLDVGGNKLTGTIPQWIGTHLTSLTVLSLRFNKFHGNIHPTICHLTDIQILDLSRNNISGKIPECFNNFTSFVQEGNSTESTRFYVYPNVQNHFESVPYVDTYADNVLVHWKGRESEYRKLGILKGIDLSSNKLVGTIPHHFAYMRGLVFLNLSRNHLTGNIISSIGQMERLEWLDLSRNKLSGKIPNSLAKLHFLSVLDLSNNNLTGMIPLGTQLQSFDPSMYAGNSQLCGLPLAECPRESPKPDHGHGSKIEEDDDEFISREFYICMAFGFITGFWSILVPLFLKHSWRHSFFNFWSNIGDWIYVTTMVHTA
ncbi:receptor 12 [Olea europaea subsp. europaea]|uniref:Receptor 12 n=1 Tax=Olea europaea subsp. europaea TaxID=158383 RepID=A0A8S0RK61_OLEEU|nr:receptor 12 [Olea europaea subsp. europaea]